MSEKPTPVDNSKLEQVFGLASSIPQEVRNQFLTRLIQKYNEDLYNEEQRLKSELELIRSRRSELKSITDQIAEYDPY